MDTFYEELYSCSCIWDVCAVKHHESITPTRLIALFHWQHRVNLGFLSKSAPWDAVTIGHHTNRLCK